MTGTRPRCSMASHKLCSKRKNKSPDLGVNPEICAKCTKCSAGGWVHDPHPGALSLLSRPRRKCAPRERNAINNPRRGCRGCQGHCLFPSPPSWPHAACLRSPRCCHWSPRDRDRRRLHPWPKFGGGWGGQSPDPHPEADSPVLVVVPGHFARCRGGGCNNGVVVGKKIKVK